MIKNGIWNRYILRDRGATVYLPFVMLALMLLGGGIGIFLPPILSKVLPRADRIGGSIVTFGPFFWGPVIGTLLIALIIILCQDEFAAVIVVAASILFDWYLQTYFVALLIALVLLISLLARSKQYSRVRLPALWLWLLFLGLIALAALRGILTTYDALYYYPDTTLGAFIMFWLGTMIARDVTSVRRFLNLLAGFGTLIAIHAIIQATTGTFLFSSSFNDNYFASLSNFILIPGLAVQRVASFFLNPDWGGPFFAVTLFIALGFFIGEKPLTGKIIYLTEACLIATALLFTYTYGAMIGACGGIIVLIALAGRMRYRLQLFLGLLFFIIIALVVFSFQLSLLQQRPSDYLIRFGAWQTALQVIEAFPMTGVGLGLSNYMTRAEPYRVPAQYIPLVHPLNSYLELGAVGGLPVLLTFIVLLLIALRLALRNWIRAEAQDRSLLGGCIAAVVALSIDSCTNNVWTVPPLAILGWLILGVISSPLLLEKLNHSVAKSQNS